MMVEKARDILSCDVAVMGGGKAGLMLALQLRRKHKGLRIVVLERNHFPVPETAHKVGESTVELSARYFRQELGLQGLLQREHLPKCGLRFFFSAGDNTDISKRVEMGHFTWPLQPSDQIERGKLENSLAAMLREQDVSIYDGWRVRSIELGDPVHHLRLSRGEEELTCEARWVVDATGRSGRLKRTLGLSQELKHSCSAVWFRVDRPLMIDGWSDAPSWQWQPKLRHLATNHLMGPGYWVWLIPLSSGSTSVGIVFDEQFVPFEQVHTFEKAMAWLDANEPQCAHEIRQADGVCLDFRVMKHYAHKTSAFFGEQRWALVGEAGSFADPLYSSGADFIAIANTLTCDLILREEQGEPLTERVEAYNQLLLRQFDSFVDLFRKQYIVMGHAQAMTAKVVWDFSVYWAFICPLFFQNKLTDLAFLQRVNRLLQQVTHLNKTVQRLFQRWAKWDQGEWANCRVDYGEILFMQGLLYNLTLPQDDEALEASFEGNLRLLQTVARLLIEHARDRCPKLASYPSLTMAHAIKPSTAPTNGDWVPTHLNTHLSVEEDLKRIWLGSAPSVLGRKWSREEGVRAGA